MDAALSEDAQTPNAGKPGVANQVGLDHQVPADRFGVHRVVGMDAATLLP